MVEVGDSKARREPKLGSQQARLQLKLLDAHGLLPPAADLQASRAEGRKKLRNSTVAWVERPGGILYS